MGRYAIIIVLAFSISILIYGQSNRTILVASNFNVVDQFSINQAQNIAESASLFLVNSMLDPDNDTLIPESNQIIRSSNDSSVFEPWGALEGSYRYTIENIEDSLIILSTVGQFDSRTYQIDVLFDFASSAWEPDLSKAVFAEDGIQLTGSARIRGHAGTNSTAYQAVKLAWSTKIDSSLVIGPGGDISTTVLESNFSNGNVGLSITALPTPIIHELPEFPEFPSESELRSNLIISGWPAPSPLSPSDYDGKYIPVLRMTGNNTLNINVGSQDRVLHVGQLDIQQGHINVFGEGKLTIYVEDKITLNGSSTINNNRTSDKMFTYYKGANTIDFGGSTSWIGGIYAESANVNISGSGGIKGNILSGGNSINVTGNAEAFSRVIFAPNAHVSLSGSGRVKGAVIAKSFTASGGTSVVFSDQLNDQLPDFDDGEDVLVVRNWRR